MLKKSSTLALVGVLSLAGPLLDPAVARAADSPSEAEEAPPIFSRPVVYVDLVANTGKPRGRSSFGILPILRNKLNAAGYRVTQDASAPRDATLRVRYREERGRKISTSLYGTHIFWTVTFARVGETNSSQVTIEELPEYGALISAPYVEVMESLQINPYFYYLASVLQGWMAMNQDPAASLIDALDRDLYPIGVPEPTPLDTLLSPSETFADLQEHYAPVARTRAIEEVGRLKDRRGLDLLFRLTTHEDRFVRAQALRTLEGFERSVVRSAVLRAAGSDPDHTVRETARALLERIPD